MCQQSVAPAAAANFTSLPPPPNCPTSLAEVPATAAQALRPAQRFNFALPVCDGTNAAGYNASTATAAASTPANQL
jgi:hypothetical protein